MVSSVVVRMESVRRYSLSGVMLLLLVVVVVGGVDVVDDGVSRGSAEVDIVGPVMMGRLCNTSWRY